MRNIKKDINLISVIVPILLMAMFLLSSCSAESKIKRGGNSPENESYKIITNISSGINVTSDNTSERKYVEKNDTLLLQDVPDFRIMFQKHNCTKKDKVIVCDVDAQITYNSICDAMNNSAVKRIDFGPCS